MAAPCSLRRRPLVPSTSAKRRSRATDHRHTGEVLEIRRGWRDGEAVFELRGALPPHRQGPPMHIHHFEDEEGTVVSGRLSADVGGRRVTLGPGERVRLPRGVPHRWWNDGDEPLVFEGIARPTVDFDRYLQGVFEVVNAGEPNRPPLFYLASLALRHRQTQTPLIMPTAVQAVVFRLVVLLGTVLGRYRGSDWPGCPTRCMGAAAAGEKEDAER